MCIRDRVNVNKIAAALEAHQVQLMKDVVMLDKLYEKMCIRDRPRTGSGPFASPCTTSSPPR